MQLKRLEIQGFKSFANKIEINFEHGITGVVGPNGSGKSNISDSIRWVLGEQSAKSLRGSKMEDVIFSGTASRKPLGMAEVSITLDNSSQYLPIDYDEVTITRRVYRSGESEYYLNKSSCRLKDVRELLMDTGIGKEGYSIIGQGKIDEILSNKSEDRRQIFEEAAGIVKYKTRKDEAERKLTSTKENLLRVLDILHELESQLIPLEKQSNKAQRYKMLKDSLLKLEVNLFIKEIDKIDVELKHIYEQINILNKSLEEQKSEKDLFLLQLEELQKSISECDGHIACKQDEYYNVQKQIEKIEGKLNLRREKSSNNNINVSRIKLEIQEIQFLQADLKNKLDQRLILLDDVSKELKTIKVELDSRKSEYNHLFNSNSTMEKLVEDSKIYIIETLNEISDRKSEARSLKTLMDTMDIRMQQVKDEYNSFEVRALEKTKEIQSFGENLDIADGQKKDILDNIGENNIGKEKFQKELKGITDEVNALENGVRNKETRKNIIEEMERELEGFSKSVKNILLACRKDPQLGEGIFGTVVDLIKVPKGYELAIETALGSTIQNIVSRDENDGKRLIEYLKKYNLGRITVLPLTTIKGRSISSEELRSIKNFEDVKIAYDVIKFDKEYNEIFSSILSRVLIVPNLDKGLLIAKELKYKFKIVTLDGDVLNIGGSLTGGSSASKNNSILGRKRELEDLIIDIDEAKKKLYIKREQQLELDEAIKNIDKNIEDLNFNLQETRIQIATLNNRIEQLNREKIDLEGLVNHSKSEIIQIENTKLETNDRYLKLENEIIRLEQNIENTKRNVSDEQQQLTIKRQELDTINNILTQLKVKLATVEGNKKGLLNEIEGFQLSFKSSETTKGNKEGELLELIEMNLDYEKEEKGLNLELNDLLSSIGEYVKELKEYKDYKEVQHSKENEIKVMSKQVESVYLELQESIHKLDVKRTRLEMQQQSFYTKLWEDYELTYNDALVLKEELEDFSSTNKEIKALKDEVKSLGTVSMDSIEEYSKVKERFEFLRDQQTDLNQAQESLLKVIGDMEITMQKQFIEQFKIIKQNFNSVFIKLFGGGSADLVLEDEQNVLECGIDIIAQPPGKKLQSLSLLSGGERALTAISLLFGILLVKPSPFCILDEIEAALDDANVSRYAKFLRELSEETQFIVVTHRKGTMENVDALYGVTMQDEGVSTLISVKLTDDKKDEKAS